MRRTVRASIALPALLLLVLGMTMAGACGSKAGRSLVKVNVVPPAGVVPVRVDVTVSKAGSDLKTEPFAGLDWTMAHVVGVYLDSSVTGQVTVSAKGYDAMNAQVASGSGAMPVDVVAGQETAQVTVTMVASSGGGTGGAGGSGTGSGGAGGAGAGTGGGSGGMPGTGGAGGGTGPTGGTGMGMTGVAGASGMGGGAPSGRSFQGPALAETNILFDDRWPATAVDGKGNIVTAYAHGSTLWANYYDAAMGKWGTEGPVDQVTGSTVSWINVAVDKNGKWLIVYLQDADSTPHGIWQSTSSDGVHWSMPSAIINTGRFWEPIMAMNQDGIAAVTWLQSVAPDSNHAVFASVRGTNGTWSAPKQLSNAPDMYERNQLITVSGPGDVVAVWEQPDEQPMGTITSLYMARYTGGAWGASTLVESYDTNNAYSAGVASNKAGQIVITWIQDTSSGNELWARRYPATGMPDGAVKAGEAKSIGYSPPPVIALDQTGNATIAGALMIGDRLQAFTTRAAWGQAWSTFMPMETDNAAGYDNLRDAFEYAVGPTLAVDDAGDLLLAWNKRVNIPKPADPNDTPFRWDGWARVYSASTATWGPATLLEMEDSIGSNPSHATGVFDFKAAMGPSGVGVVTWYYGYDYNIWANIYR